MKPRIMTKYGLMGDTMFVVESPMRYTACVVSGEMLSSMSIGTRTGAMSVHRPEPEVMKSAPTATSR